MAQAGESSSFRAYWRKTLAVTGLLGVLWVIVSVGVPWFAPQWQGQVWGFPLSYWLAAQGALLVFLAIVVGYAVWMEAIEARHRAPPAPTSPDVRSHGGR